MSVCATCGRQRTGAAPFCAGCGTRFPDAADGAGEPAVPDASLKTEAPESGSAETRWDTRVGMPGGRPAPSPVPPTRPSSAFPPPDQPPMAAPGPIGSYPGPMPPGEASFGPRPPSPRRGGSGPLIALVVVLVLAVGGGAFALVSSLTSRNNTAQPSTQPTTGAPATASSGGGSQTPAPSVSASATSPAAPADTAVAVAPTAAGNAAAPQVQTLLEHYFAAINTHDYAAYSSLLDAQMRGENSRSHFDSGYGTTHDSAETLTSISNAGGGVLAAAVSFTSHQSPADSINNSSCTAWTITLYLEPQSGGGYLIGAPPAGYQPSHQDCP